MLLTLFVPIASKKLLQNKEAEKQRSKSYSNSIFSTIYFQLQIKNSKMFHLKKSLMLSHYQIALAMDPFGIKSWKICPSIKKS